MKSEIQALAVACQLHLKREEHLLEGLLHVVSQFRESIRARASDRLSELIDQHSHVNEQAEHVSRDRQRLREEIAQLLSVPPQQATVGLLAKHCDDATREALEEGQNRLKAAGEQLSVQLVASHQLAFQLLNLLENVFRSLSGDPVMTPVYGRDGRTAVA